MDIFGAPLETKLLFYIPMLLSLSVHEWAHAAAANYLGDDTARLQGRLSLNPLVHIDPVGTLLLPLLGVPFGWAKPVPFNPLRFDKSVTVRSGTLFVAFAGPLSNLVFAAVCYLWIKSTGIIPSQIDVSGDPFSYLVFLLFMINISLAIFNMIPIPPLDGSKVVDSLMPDKLRPAWDFYCENSYAILFALVFLPAFFKINLIGKALKPILEILL